MVEGLPAERQVYFIDREAQWETSLAGANSKAVDALEACADYNTRLREANGPAG